MMLSSADFTGFRTEFAMLTEGDNFAACHVTARDNETDVTTENTREHIVNWLNECDTNQCCPEQVDLPLPLASLILQRSKPLPPNPGRLENTRHSHIVGALNHLYVSYRLILNRALATWIWTSYLIQFKTPSL
jgi:hypothetical protein